MSEVMTEKRPHYKLQFQIASIFTAHITLSLPRGAKNRHNPNLPYDIMKTLTEDPAAVM